MTGTFQTLPRQYRCSTFSYLPGSRHLDNRHQKISDGISDGRNGISDGSDENSEPSYVNLNYDRRPFPQKNFKQRNSHAGFEGDHQFPGQPFIDNSRKFSGPPCRESRQFSMPPLGDKFSGTPLGDSRLVTRPPRPQIFRSVSFNGTPPRPLDFFRSVADGGGSWASQLNINQDTVNLHTSVHPSHPSTHQLDPPASHQSVNQFSHPSSHSFSHLFNQPSGNQSANQPIKNPPSLNIFKNQPKLSKPSNRPKTSLWKSKSLANISLEKQDYTLGLTDSKLVFSLEPQESNARASIYRKRSGSFRNLLALQESKGLQGPLGATKGLQGTSSSSKGPAQGQNRGLKKVEPPTVPLRKKYRSLSGSFANLISNNKESSGNGSVCDSRLTMANFNYPPHSGCPPTSFQQQGSFVPGQSGQSGPFPPGQPGQQGQQFYTTFQTPFNQEAPRPSFPSAEGRLPYPGGEHAQRPYPGGEHAQRPYPGGESAQHSFNSPFRGQQGGVYGEGGQLRGEGGQLRGEGGQHRGEGGQLRGKGVHAIHCADDQGIDMALSPGRDSPGHDSTASSAASTSGTSRNSTTSIDSGRASNSTLENRPSLLGHAHRLSNVSSQSCSESIGSSQQSHHSSNSSLGERGEDSICSLNIQDMLNAGIPDEDILTAWLTDLHFEEYYHLFTSAGYDMPTISRMTPEDLTAVGIKKPNHRKKLKAEIGRLNICDGLPDYIPDTLEDWLGLLRLEEYGPNLRSQNYNTIADVTTISIEDLEDTGFYRLGHQKRLLLAIRRAKELLTGKRVNQPAVFQPQDVASGVGKLPPRPSLSSFSHSGHFDIQQQQQHFQPVKQHHQQQQQHHQQQQQHQNQQLFHHNSQIQTFQPQQQQHNQQQQQQQHNQQQPQQHTAYHPEFLRITQGYPDRVSEDPVSGIPDPMPPLQYPLYQTSFQGANTPFQGGYPGSPRFTPRAAGGLGPPPAPSPWRMLRSYDDADILRHADHSVLIHEAPRPQSKSGTLPRPKGTVKPRPVAKIIAKTRDTARDSEPENDVINQDQQEFKKVDCDSEESSPPPGLRSLHSSPTPTLRRKSRSGSDAGLQMKKNSSFDSESGLPFANDNAGTIRIRERSNSQVAGLPADRPDRPRQDGTTTPKRVPGRTAGDVLNDIGTMLADLTDELDAMLQLERDNQ